MGSPQYPTPEQYAQLENAGRLAEIGPPSAVTVRSGEARARFRLPRQGVSLLQLAW